MKCILFLLFGVLYLPAFCQVQKGGAPVQSAVDGPQSSDNETYAVVIGISDYQDEDIPDLRFADRDAEIFAQYLQSPTGGSLDGDHMELLTNEDATAGNVISALFWLLEVCGEDDRAIIYFSGHGDVESRLSDQPGYLLCWNALARVYAAGGVVELGMMQQIISTLSLENKAKVLLITDACRSGKLSGSAIGGPQVTAASLMRQYANEVKILSCQPDEYSIEGEQWGGGRGAFSYHLVDGLSGLADDNEDGTVTLMEIGRYLQDKVSTEVAPLLQIPMTVGNFKEELVSVDPEILDGIRRGKNVQMVAFAATDHRGIRDQVLSSVDSQTARTFYAFEDALGDARFLSPKEDCAEYYYQLCLSDPSLDLLHSSMTRNYAAVLQDDAQRVINRLLRGDPEENVKTYIQITQEYGHYPKDLRRAAELLGEGHYMYRPLMARAYWFEGYIHDESRCACFNTANAKKVLPYYYKALEYQPEMPHAWIFMSAIYGIEMSEIDSAAYYANLAYEVVPEWTLIPHWISNVYLNHYSTSTQESSLEKAELWLDRGMALDSNSSIILDQLAYLYNLKGMYEKEQAILDRSFTLDSLAMTQMFKGMGYSNWGKIADAEKAFLTAIRLDSSLILESNGLVKLYAQTREWKKLDALLERPIIRRSSSRDLTWIANDIFWVRPERALEIYMENIASDSTNATVLNRIALAHTYLEDRNYKEALKWHKKSIELDPDFPVYHNNEGLIYLRWNDVEKAEQKFRDALAVDSSFSNAYGALFMLYFQDGKTSEAETYLKKAMSMKSNSVPDFLTWVGNRAILDPKMVLLCFQAIEKRYPMNPSVNYEHAQYLILFGDDKEGAYHQLEIALQKGLKNYGSTWLYPLRMDGERWDALIRKYHPSPVAD